MANTEAQRLSGFRNFVDEESTVSGGGSSVPLTPPEVEVEPIDPVSDAPDDDYTGEGGFTGGTVGESPSIGEDEGLSIGGGADLGAESGGGGNFSPDSSVSDIGSGSYYHQDGPVVGPDPSMEGEEFEATVLEGEHMMDQATTDYFGGEFLSLMQAVANGSATPAMQSRLALLLAEKLEEGATTVHPAHCLDQVLRRDDRMPHARGWTCTCGRCGRRAAVEGANASRSRIALTRIAVGQSSSGLSAM